MKLLNWFNLAVMLGAALFTWNALADGSAPKVHMVHNLNARESSRFESALKEMGYQVSKKPMFSDSKDTIIITKILANEVESAAVSMELVRLEPGHKLPRTVFEYRAEGNDLQAVIEAFPRPATFASDSTKPAVAYSTP